MIAPAAVRVAQSAGCFSGSLPAGRRDVQRWRPMLRAATTEGPSGGDQRQVQGVVDTPEAGVVSGAGTPEGEMDQSLKFKMLRWVPNEGFANTWTNGPRGDVDVSQAMLGGKLAVLGLAAVLLAERVTGEGAVQFVCDEVALVDSVHPQAEVNPLVSFFIFACVTAALLPGSRGGKEEFTSFAERFQSTVGRLAFLLLGWLLIAELATGKAVLELLNIETGVQQLSDFEAVAAFFVLLLFTGKTKHRTSS